MNIVSFLCVLFMIFDSSEMGLCLRCYECVSRLGPADTDACLTGDRNQLPRVRCIGPSVCATYHYQSTIPGTPTINHVTRGCQLLRYGGSCEDIFNDLRSRGEVLPGQHTCATCSGDLCNSTTSLKALCSLISICIFSSFYFSLLR
ncbi:uncharacterized protein LOC130901859 isoform X1 [Diorhabda carinulata]|uniref:uncharacterized protein LOC130901859 isoform X1 n=1 Tax=Diorhabda carinulata TaxID=1163345 RepID=UPI0025A0A5AB|nr:uncharacterized protein LOC130901859 isoform X1 [Diorhabda carinulata]